MASKPKKPRQRHSPLRFRLYAVVTALGATLLAYYACEAVYRVSQSRKLDPARFSFDLDSVTEAPLYQFDQGTGYRYIANTRTRIKKFSEDDGEVCVDNQLRINNHGHISHQDDLLEKPPGEFRIALLGDSFTAALEMQRPWPDVAEEFLNQDDTLRQAVDAQTFNVINFARDGTGIIQMGEVYQHEARKFDPDLVIVNFIPNDIRRRVIYRRSIQRDLGDFNYHVGLHTFQLPCSPENQRAFFGGVTVAPEDFDDPEKRDRLFTDIGRVWRKRIRWLSPYPELFAAKFGYQFGMKPRIFPFYAHEGFLDEREAIKGCIAALRHVVATSKRSLLLHMPQSADNADDYLVANLTRRAPELQLIAMRGYLPADADQQQRESWYIRGDGHLNDLGGKVYAQALVRKVKESLLESEDEGVGSPP